MTSVPISSSVKSKPGRLGPVLFVLYLAVYAAYVLINAFWPAWMDVLVGGGLNLAVVYGFGLILSAFVFALIYARFCRQASSPTKAR